MATNTSIEWADKTWSPIIGCDRVSPGCDSCYAISTARIRESNPHPSIAAAFAGTTQDTDNGVDWSGQINILEDRFSQPLRWKKPYRIFVNSLSDLFHQGVGTPDLHLLFGVMAATPQHTYQILTKRHGRMRSLLNDPQFAHMARHRAETVYGLPAGAFTWPLPNVWLGVSVEDQKHADLRIPALLDTPAAIRFLSCEPLLGPVNLARFVWAEPSGLPGDWERGIDWVICGGESGPKARPMHPDWARALRNQCTAASVPFLFKQWGTWGVDWPLDKDGKVITTGRGLGITVANDGTVYQPGDLTYPDGPRWGEALRANHGQAHLTAMYRLGKKKAGRELDGRTHTEFPAVTR